MALFKASGDGKGQKNSSNPRFWLEARKFNGLWCVIGSPLNSNKCHWLVACIYPSVDDIQSQLGTRLAVEVSVPHCHMQTRKSIHKFVVNTGVRFCTVLIVVEFKKLLLGRHSNGGVLHLTMALLWHMSLNIQSVCTHRRLCSVRRG